MELISNIIIGMSVGIFAVSWFVNEKLSTASMAGAIYLLMLSQVIK